MKNTNARGNSELTNKFVEEITQYMSIALTHLANKFFWTRIFPDALKYSRFLPLKKQGKPADQLV